MPTEIPQLEVITAIGEVETEDYVAQLLFSQGWNIIHRAIDFASVVAVLEERNEHMRTVVVYSSDLDGFDLATIVECESRNPAFSVICIDGIPVNSHLLMTHIRSSLRSPLISAPSTQFLPVNEPAPQRRKQKLVTITGTSGSPGRSHLTLLLASYLSWRSSVQVFDADLRSPSLAYLAGSKSHLAERLTINTLDMASKPSQLPIGDYKELSLVDIGPLPSLRDVVADRRWQASLINSILEQTTSLIYITKSSGLGLLRLENFISEFPILLRKLPIIYILNQLGTSREDRSIESRFSSLTMGERSFVLPQDSRPLNPNRVPTGRIRGVGAELFSSTSKLAKEIDKIAQAIV